MKNIWLIIIFILALAACTNDNQAVPGNTPTKTAQMSSEDVDEPIATDADVDHDEPQTEITESKNTMEEQLTATPVPPQPAPSDKMEPSSVYVDMVQMIMLETFPIQVQAIVNGSLPDSCTEIQEFQTSFDEESNTFNVHIQAIRPADAMCAQMLEPFEETIALKTNGFKAGTYTVDVDGVTATFELTVDQTN